MWFAIRRILQPDRESRKDKLPHRLLPRLSVKGLLDSSDSTVNFGLRRELRVLSVLTDSLPGARRKKWRSESKRSHCRTRTLKSARVPMFPETPHIDTVLRLRGLVAELEVVEA